MWGKLLEINKTRGVKRAQNEVIATAEREFRYETERRKIKQAELGTEAGDVKADVA
jgi:hypothetical protein